MRTLTRFRTIVAACALLGIVWLTVPAFGQGSGVLNPGDIQRQAAEAEARRATAAPQPNINKEYPTWVGYIVMLLMTVGIIPLALMPSKRSHQD